MTDILGPANANAVTVRPARSIVRGSTATWFRDCSSPLSEDGTPIGADFLNDVLAQLRVAISSADILADGNDDMLWRAMQAIAVRYAPDTGAPDNLVASFSPPVRTLYDGLLLGVKVAATNTGAATIACNGLPPAPIRRRNGAALAAGDLIAGQYALLAYLGGVFQHIALSATEGGNWFKIPYVEATGTATDLVAAFTPAIVGIGDGTFVSIKLPANINLANATTLNVNGLGAVPVRNAAGFASGYAFAGDVVTLEYVTNQWRVVAGLVAPNSGYYPIIGGYFAGVAIGGTFPWLGGTSPTTFTFATPQPDTNYAILGSVQGAYTVKDTLPDGSQSDRLIVAGRPLYAVSKTINSFNVIFDVAGDGGSSFVGQANPENISFAIIRTA
jgi:hypothetical protein